MLFWKLLIDSYVFMIVVCLIGEFVKTRIRAKEAGQRPD